MDRKYLKYVSAACYFMRYTLMLWIFVYLSVASFYLFSSRPTMLMDIEQMIDQRILDLASFVLVIPAYYSLARSFSITEPFFKSAVAEKRYEISEFSDKAGFVLKTPFIYIELAIIALFTPLIFKSGAFMQLLALIPNPKASPLVGVAFVVCAFTISFFARVHAIGSLTYKESFEVIKMGRGDVKYNLWYLVRMTALLMILFPFASMAMLYVVSILALPFAFEMKDTLTILSIVLAVAVFLVLRTYILTFFKRRKFLKTFKKFCKKNNFKLEDQKNMIRSAFADYEGYNFLIHANQKIYACKILGSRHRNRPMYFTENGEVYTVKVKSMALVGSGAMAAMVAMNGATTLSRRAKLSSFAFESEYPKLVIVNPIPNKIFAGHPENSAPIDTGAKIGEYRIFNSSGFMNALERDCVER